MPQIGSCTSITLLLIQMDIKGGEAVVNKCCDDKAWAKSEPTKTSIAYLFPLCMWKGDMDALSEGCIWDRLNFYLLIHNNP